MSPPSDCPDTPMRVGSMSPRSGPARFAASMAEITKLTSAGWLTRSLSSGPPGAFSFSSGNTGAATTYPARAHACSSRLYRSGITAKPCPKMTSGKGP